MYRIVFVVCWERNISDDDPQKCFNYFILCMISMFSDDVTIKAYYRNDTCTNLRKIYHHITKRNI